MSTSASDDGESSIDRKKAFDHLYQALVEYHLRFVDGSLKGTGLVVILAGWIITQASARDFMSTHEIVRVGAAIVVALCALAYVGISLRMVSVMRNLGRELADLAYFPADYYAFRILTPRVAALVMVFTIVPCVGTIVVILSIPHTS